MEIFEIVKFDQNGFVPVITQDFYNKEVLMFAYANKEALQKTVETGYAHYFSRSRKQLWKKGEESGNIQKIKQILFDCDEDCVLYKVEQIGCACHTFHRSCFFREYFRGQVIEIEPQLGENFKETVYNVQNSTLNELYETILQRKNDMPQNSYTAKLFSSGVEKIAKKINEETLEFLFALKENDASHIIYEASDCLYHLLVGLAYRKIPLDAILEELKRRKNFSGEFEKKTR
ncbi:Phosphoribosyl-AMP cyclohydrolase [Desulfurella amilsii]|uniref:Histidine biosynthesis bifunctional protein HisIE n=1 Tax=Desulfurella amilsii TaxID=1562698 RepID=A0A1X4XWK9_9BACT|nr:bifunctional phosphoribosyl-AMP cyclohydrolase/phosphoribosyl-ATP diphosphatase HisIE [Desulfurella amilsii]OSS41904.1 Phosphoribosyl-AMP cyclohydrolase [Desulfurella amilsii]